MGYDNSEPGQAVFKALMPGAVGSLMQLIFFGAIFFSRVIQIQKATGSADDFFNCVAVHVGVVITTIRNRCISFGIDRWDFNVFSCEDVQTIPELFGLSQQLCPGMKETQEKLDEAAAELALCAAALSVVVFASFIIVCCLRGECCSRSGKCLGFIVFLLNLGQVAGTIMALIFSGKALKLVRSTPWWLESISLSNIPGFSSEIGGGFVPSGAYLIRGSFNGLFITFMFFLCLQVAGLAVVSAKTLANMDSF